MIKKISVLLLFLGSGLMLFGQEVLSKFITQEASPIRQAGDFLLQDDLLIEYIRDNPAVVIPEDLGITTIGDGAFKHKHMESVIIPEGITKIGNSAFTGCQNLGQVQLPESLTTLGEGVFSGCAKLTDLTVPEKNGAYITIEGVLFTKDLQRLIAYPAGKDQTAYNVPEQVQRIDSDAFRNAFNLEEITFPESLRSIGERAFYNCKGLTSLKIPKGLTSIENRAFSRCVNLEVLRIPAGLNRIGEAAFDGCTKLETIEFSKPIQISDTAFRNVPAKLPYVD